MNPIHVSDHAMLRWLERAHGLDVAALRRHLAGRAVNAARLGAIAVTIDNVKLVLRATGDGGTSVVTVILPGWPARKGLE